MLIPPPLSQHLTFPLLSVTLLVSFGSSMLYGYNLAVVNSPAVVRDGQRLWEQGKGSASLSGRMEGPLPSSRTSKCWHFPWAVTYGEQARERDGMGGTREPVFMYSPQSGFPWKAGAGESCPQPPCSSSSSVCGISKLSLNPSGAEAG